MLVTNLDPTWMVLVENWLMAGAVAFTAFIGNDVVTRIRNRE